MSDTNFPRGSEWRKWDLQLHTPNSHLNGKYNCTFKEVSDKIKSEQLAVVGVTNYFIVEEAEISELQKELGDAVLLIPNFEFRINDKNKDGEFINIHVLFNPSTVALQKVYDCLRRVKLNNLPTDQPEYCTIESIKKYGADGITVSLDELIEQLKTDFKHSEDFLIAGVCRGYGGFHPDNKPRNINLAVKLDKTSHIIFGNGDDTLFFLNAEGERAKEIEILKSVLCCSDAHTIGDIGQKFTWIKSDPTFEGLKQIIYEPEERVRIQETNPAFDFEKFAFTEIEISKAVKVFQSEQLQFEKCSVPLNQNLVTIIGGRGTGKSILINFIANGFKQLKEVSSSLLNLSADFKVKWKKSHTSTEDTFVFDKQHDLQFLFISQSEVKEKVRDPKDLGNEIKKILELETLSFNLKTDETIQQYKTEFNTNQEWFDKKDENNNPINTKTYVEGEIEKNKNLLERITTEENKEKLEKYSSNIEKLQSNETDKINLQQLKDDLAAFQTTTNEQITELNKGIPVIDFKPQTDAIDKAVSNIDGIIKVAQEENAKIKEDFKDFKGDLTSLLSNVERFRITISTYERRLKEIEEKEKHLAASLENKKKISELIKSELERQKKTIDENWNKLLQGKDGWNEGQKDLMKRIINNRGIKIEGEIVFNKNAFFDLIKDQLDGRTFKGKHSYAELETLVGITDYSSFIAFINDIANSIEKVKYHLRFSVEEFEKIFYELRTRSTYLYVQPNISFDGKPLEKISVGQRGTIYLCLKLATNIFSQTIIFDQPEDDLDNDFIFKDLIKIFKEIKKYRQVIIVTHNANLVVNADAEQVIVAFNNEEKLSYTSGSLENPDINLAVCNILEGGKIAFQQRKNKYHLN